MREIVERDPQKDGDSENLDDVGAACHRYNSNLRDAAARRLLRHEPASRTRPIRRKNETWVPFLDTYRTMCLAPQPDFRRVLDDVGAMQLAA